MLADSRMDQDPATNPFEMAAYTSSWTGGSQPGLSEQVVVHLGSLGQGRPEPADHRKAGRRPLTSAVRAKPGQGTGPPTDRRYASSATVSLLAIMALATVRRTGGAFTGFRQSVLLLRGLLRGRSERIVGAVQAGPHIDVRKNSDVVCRLVWDAVDRGPRSLGHVWLLPCGSERPALREKEIPMAGLRRTWLRSRAVAFLAALGVVFTVAMAAPASATSPGDNGRIAFKGYLDADRSTGAIFTIRPDGTRVRQITFPAVGTVDDQPDWSPNGSLIAFRRCHRTPSVRSTRSGRTARSCAG